MALIVPAITGTPGLRRRPRRRAGIVFQPGGRLVRPFPPQPREEAAGAAAGIEQPAMAGPDGVQRIEDLGMQGAIPPHAVLDRVHQIVFSKFHAAVLARSRLQEQGAVAQQQRELKLVLHPCGR